MNWLIFLFLNCISILFLHCRTKEKYFRILSYMHYMLTCYSHIAALWPCFGGTSNLCLLFFVPFGSIDDETTNLQKVFYTFLCSLSSKFVSIKNMYADFFVLLNSSLTNFKNTNIEEICKGANTFIQNCVCLFFSFSKVQCIFVSVTNS